MDGTLIQAWASQETSAPKDGGSDDANGGTGRNAQADWKGRPRSNDTHASTTDPDARLFRKSHNTAAILALGPCADGEPLSGLVVAAMVTHADGLGERAAAPPCSTHAAGHAHPKTVAADKAYDTRDFIAACRRRRITPHVAANDTRIGGSAIDSRMTRHPGYALSQTIRKRIEEHFGWGKTVGRIRRTVYRGLERVDQHRQAHDDGQQHRAYGRECWADPRSGRCVSNRRHRAGGKERRGTSVPTQRTRPETLAVQMLDRMLGAHRSANRSKFRQPANHRNLGFTGPAETTPRGSPCKRPPDVPRPPLPASVQQTHPTIPGLPLQRRRWRADCGHEQQQNVATDRRRSFLTIEERRDPSWAIVVIGSSSSADDSPVGKHRST